MRDCDPDYFSYIDISIRDTTYLYHLVHVIGSGSIFKEALVAEVVNRSNHPVAGSVHGVPAVGHVDVGVWPVVGVEQAPGKRCHGELLVSDCRYTGARLAVECSRYTWWRGWSRTPRPGKSNTGSKCSRGVRVDLGVSRPHLVHHHCVRLRLIHELAIRAEKGEDKDLAIGL